MKSKYSGRRSSTISKRSMYTRSSKTDCGCKGHMKTVKGGISVPADRPC